MGPPARPPPVRLLLFAAALAQPTNEPSDHQRGQPERDDHARADEHIGENYSGAALDGHDARRRFASMPLYGQWSGSPRRFNALSCFNVRLDSPAPCGIYMPIMLLRRVAFPEFCEPCLPRFVFGMAVLATLLVAA